MHGQAGQLTVVPRWDPQFGKSLDVWCLESVSNMIAAWIHLPRHRYHTIRKMLHIQIYQPVALDRFDGITVAAWGRH